MDREKRKTLAFGILLVIIVLAAVFYFLWGIYLDRGTIKIVAEPPFNVQILGTEKIICTVSPCEITQKSGIRDLILEKEGHETLVKEVKVKLWKTVDLEVEFEIIPHFSKTDILPQPEEEISYEIISDEENRMYKLVDSEDNQERAIVYFQKKISSPQIFSSKNAALIIGEVGKQPTVYKVDIRGKTREKITGFDFQNIVEGQWSNDGENFVFSTEDSSFLWLLDSENSVRQLALNIENSKYAWTYSGSLLFITEQEAQPAPKAGKYSGNYIELLSSKSTLGYTFGKYHPDEDSYTKIEFFSEISGLPEVLIPASNGQIIYFQVGEDKYKLLLK